MSDSSIVLSKKNRFEQQKHLFSTSLFSFNIFIKNQKDQNSGKTCIHQLRRKLTTSITIVQIIYYLRDSVISHSISVQNLL